MPHDRLIPRLAAVVHHGAARTATRLCHGRLCVVVPFFGDQPFWGERVHQLGVGPKPISFSKLNIEHLAGAIDQAVKNPKFLQSAQALGKEIQAEHGVDKAVGMISAFLESAATSPGLKS